MKEMKRFLSLLLCFAMLVGILPAGVLRAEAASTTGEVVDAAIMFSDLHTNTSDHKESTIKGIMSALKNTGLPFSSVTSCGDAFSSGTGVDDGSTSYINTAIRDGLGNTSIPVYYAWSDHDRGAPEVTNDSYLMYGNANTNYYIYTISMSDMCTSDRYSAGFHNATKVAEEIAEFTGTVASMDQSKPLFIVSHVPLHAIRNDNGYAYQWYQAISAAAENMDIAFFWGHNHSTDDCDDAALFYVPNDGSEAMTVQDVSGTQSVTPNFTYMCAGYMSPTNNTDKTRVGVAVAITIWDDAINYTTYNASGEYTGKFAMNQTVERKHASTEPKLVVSGKTSYFVGDKLDLTVNLKANGETTNVTEQATLTYDMSKAGKQTVTITYGQLTATYEIEVFAKSFSDQNSGVTVYVSAPGATAITVSNVSSDSAVCNAVAARLSNSVAYDIKMTDHANGTEATVTLPVPENVTNPAVYYVSDDATIINRMNVVKVEDGKVSFITDHFSYYVIGEDNIGEELYQDVTIADEAKTVYVLVDAPEAGGKYLITNKTLTNGKLTNNWNDEVDGYYNGASVAMAVIRNGSGITYGTVTPKAGTITGTDGTTYTKGYIELDNSAAVWTAEASGSDWKLSNGEYYLNNSGDSVSAGTDSSTVWTYDANGDDSRLHNGNNKLYFTYNGNGNQDGWMWKTATSDSNSSTRDIFFYKEVTGKFTVTYTMQAYDLQYYIGQDNANQAKLSYALLSTGSPAVLPEGGSYSFGVTNNNIISDISEDGTITFNNAEGTCSVKIAYTWGGYTVYKYVTVTSSKVNYTIAASDLNHNLGDNGNKAQLTYALQANGNAVSDLPVGGYYEFAVVDGTDTNGIINNIANDGTITFNKDAGSCDVKITYSWAGTAYEDIYEDVSATVTVTASKVNYTMQSSDVQHYVGENNNQEKLTYALQANGNAVSNLPGNGTYKFEVVEGTDTNGIINNISTDGTITFNDVVGECNVKITYVWGDDVYKDIYGEISTTVKVTSSLVAYTIEADNQEYFVDKNHTEGKLEFVLKANGTALDTTNLPDGVSYTITVPENNGIISSIANDGTITFTGETGTCDVTITITRNNTAYTAITKTVTVTASKPNNALEITTEYGENSEEGTVITGTQSVKGDIENATREYSAKLLYNGEILEGIDQTNVTWASSNEAIAKVDETGKVTFPGTEGMVKITATYVYENETLTDTIDIYVTKDLYIHPAEGTNDFPEYPNEGAIRFDKTAEAVGTFSQTGVAKLELSMTGVPYSTNNTLDVVLMLDRTSSMTDARISATQMATEVFVRNIVYNEDGSFTGNRIFVGDFMGGNPAYEGQAQHAFRVTQMTANEEDGYQIVDSEEEYNALISNIKAVFVRQDSCYGTEYAKSLSYCYELLKDTAGDGHKQFCVYMSDGIPNAYETTEKLYTDTGSIVGRLTNNYTTRGEGYDYEKYSTLMKAEGVTVYTVGIGLQDANAAWGDAGAEASGNVADILLNDISGPAYETANDTGDALSKLNEYFFSVPDTNAAAGMTDVFDNISRKIMEAATNVVVTDKIKDDYTMIFGIPQSKYPEHSAAVSEALEGEEFYIEFLEYALDANHERSTSTSKLKLYLGVNEVENGNNTYYAATDYNSTNGDNKFADPVFTAKAEDQKAYWSIVGNDYAAKAGEIVVKVGETNYKFIEDGTGDYNMTAGAYAYGTINSETNMSEDLVIVTPYFAYCASTRMLAWTVEKLTTVEYVLNYFLYLDNSAADISEDTETPEGPYPTNDYANITYTNFNGNDCRQEYPVPQLTWNGAQVSYVFYLVNKDGQPINKSGQVVDFANATFITEVFTEHIVWNDAATDKTDEGYAYLDAMYKAEELLPGDYTLYDKDAYYELYVYEDHEGNELNNYFKITGSEENGTTSSTTMVYNTKAGVKYSAYDTYTSVNVASGFDFANTTVAFAVVWEPALVPDVVVVDYGLDVLIDVVRNDLLQNTVSGISLTNSGYGVTVMNTGISDTSIFGNTTVLTTTAGDTITMANDNAIRFHQGDMEFNEPVTFYYESGVTFYKDSNAQNGYLYSSVTVIPATTVYYEDDFVDYTVNDFTTGDVIWKASEADKYPNAARTWVTEGTTIDAVQDTDRPGADKIGFTGYDADNNYGYDSAYTNMSTWSMGSAAKINVDSNYYGEAKFSFYGTGFDVISMTDKTTGTIFVTVTDANGNVVKNLLVDTYYGYTYDEENGWTATNSSDTNAIYQVPVIYLRDLEYGKYNVTIRASYNTFFDNTDAGSYWFYLDAIRIYDPIDTSENTDVADVYAQDHEGWPVYTELRNNIIAAAELEGNEDEINGIAFMDGVGTSAKVTDYKNYGPNNELYLMPGQAIAFNLDLGDSSLVDTIQLGIKSADGNTAAYKIFDGGILTQKSDLDNISAATLNTATDMYYDITSLKDKTIVIYNPGISSETGTQTGGILSLTNIKVTYIVNPDDTSNQFFVDADVIQKITNNLNNEGTFKTDFTVNVPTYVYAGSSITVTVTTDNDVAAVRVNGKVLTSYRVRGNQRIWTDSVSTSEAGTASIEVVAYNADGQASETTVTKTVEVKANASPIRTIIKTIKNLLSGLFG